ncbi:transcription antitermination factor NusB [Taibaiella lutea]|uniref:Transcription antitermination protein NusB n=1 Tax=Taibaiella lutea TaxID=2608001 RepID=A0A5M6CP28_9BACT|nr:transcription antitermination factor NusB [Taibaiella lutea]KAA5534909.1 transcription antitermination factor NusB [Taibaiella lutea]
MISRRNIRVKVMQAIYTLDAYAVNPAEKEKGEKAPSLEENQKTGIKVLVEKFHRSSDVFALLLLYVSKVAQYAETNARQRASKYLPTEEDMVVNTKIAGNSFLWDLLNNNTFQEKVKEDKIEHFIDEEWVKKLYTSLIKSDIYKEYITEQSRSNATEKQIMQHIWRKEMLENEDFQEYLNDEWSGWEDDKEMIVMLIDNYFRSPKNVNFLQFISAEKREYAYSLLKTVLEKDDYIMDLIKPKLKNWDAERVAIIDLILLKMGIAELLYFPTIPTKVTINEFIEIAKNYSTPQSGQFVNGVLDNLLKELTTANKIRKVERTK